MTLEENCIHLFESDFKNGYDLTFPLSYEKFRSRYESAFKISFDMSESFLQKLLSSNGLIISNKIYPFESVLSLEGVNSLINHLFDLRDQGIPRTTWAKIYEDLRSTFIDSRISPNCVKCIRDIVLHYTNEFYCDDDGVVFDSESVINNEVVDFLLNNPNPRSVEQIANHLQMMTKSDLEDYLRSSNRIEDGIIEMGSGQFTHIDHLGLDSLFYNRLNDLVSHDLSEYGWVSSKVLFNELNSLENNSYLDLFGITDGQTLIDIVHMIHPEEYSYYQGTIRSGFSSMKLKDLILNNCLQYDSFTSDKLDLILKNNGQQQWVHIEYILTEFLRVDSNNFIHKRHFNCIIEQVDSSIESLIQNGYCTTSAITTFCGFPVIGGYSWNKYLLVSYVCCFSEKYKILVKNRLSRDFECAIVDKSKFNSFYDVCVQCVLDNDVDGNSLSDLNLIFNILKKNGLLSRKRSQSDLERIQNDVKRIREKNVQL